MDETGFHDCVDMTMRFGHKYKQQNEIIRTGADGMPWEEIDHEAITDGYGIMVTGTRQMDMAEEAFKKMLSLAPLLLNDPNVRGKTEIQRQLLEKSNVFDNTDLILHGDAEISPLGDMMQQAPGVGGIPTLQNEARSQMNRSSVQQNTGNRVAAGNVMV